MAHSRGIVLRADGSKRSIDQRRRALGTRQLSRAEKLRRALLGDRPAKSERS